MDRSNVKTLQDLVRLAAEEYGDKAYLKEKGAPGEIIETSFKTFFENAKRVTAFLASLGEEKIHAAVIGTTSSAYLTAYFGTVLGGNVTVPLDAQLACDDICDLLERADVNVFFYDSRYLPMLPQIKSVCTKIKHYISLQQTDEGQCLSAVLSSNEPANLPEVSADMLASIVYTSGTTGKAKGVMLTHGNFIDNTFCADNESSPEDTLLTVLPVHHVYCFACDILLSLRYGATVCVNDSMMRIAQNLKLFSPTIILLVPMIAETIYKQISAVSKAKGIPPAAAAKAIFGGRLKGIYSGGAYLSPELIHAYLDIGIPIAQGYGMTECSPRISTASLDDISDKGDVGRIVNGCTVKIVDGEIRVKSPSVMQGYYHNPEATAEALTEDGWLCTGDLGYVEDNRIFITGRKKNLIILSNGENVSPEELENRFASVSLAADVLVYAEEAVITAEIYPDPDEAAALSKEELISRIKEIIDKINLTLPSAKAIRRIRLREKEFDKTTSKKIKRNQTEHGELI